MGISEPMKLLVATVALVLALAAGHESGPDKLALHAEHFPHAQGSKSAIYQFQIDNNNLRSKPTSPVSFTAEISPDMDVQNAYYFNELSQSKPGTPAQKGNCKVGSRSTKSQSEIRKK